MSERTVPDRGGLRIGHILPFPAIGGTEVATLRITQATTPYGIDHVIFHRADAPAVGAYFRAAGLPTVPFDPPHPSLVRRLPAFLRASARLADQLRATRLSAVHAADILGAMLAGVAGRMAGLPVLCQVRNQYATLPRRDCVLLRTVREFVFVSAHTRSVFACAHARHRGRVVYDGLDLPDQPADRAAVRASLGIPAEAPLIGMVARIAPQKDFLTLIEAVRRLRASHPTVHVLLVGDRDSTPAYRAHHAVVSAAIREAGLVNAVHFTGQRSDVTALLAAMDVFALVTHAEGLPLVLLEAMASGLPVVATAVDGIPELVRDGATGLLHPPRDAGRLAAQLGQLLDDPALRRRLAEAGRDRVRTEFSRARFGEAMVALYQQHRARQ